MDRYFLYNSIATSMVFIYNFLHYRKRKLLLSRASSCAINYFSEKQGGICKLLATAGLWTCIEIFVISMLQYYLSGVFNTIVGNLLDTGANYFGMVFFAPVLVVGFCLIVKIDPLAQLDLITPAYPLALFFSKIACYHAGCCRGVRWIYGFFNTSSRLIEFPSQLLESAVALLLFVFLFLCRNKFKKGTLFPIYLMVYSAIRFFTEFTRVEPAVFLGLKTYQILCIIGVVVGALEYVAARKYDAYTKRTKQTCTDPSAGMRSVRR